MKIKQILVQIVISLLVLVTVQSLAGGFVYSRSTPYVAIFIALIALSGWMTTRIQVFLLLPKIIPFMVVLHSVVVFFIVYISNNVIGGVTVTSLNPNFVRLLGLAPFLKSIGEFGTISVVALLVGGMYQVIIWLNSEK